MISPPESRQANHASKNLETQKKNTVCKTEYGVAFLWNFHSGKSVDHSNKNQSRNRSKAITHPEPKKQSQNRNKTKSTGYIWCRSRRSPLKINPVFFKKMQKAHSRIATKFLSIDYGTTEKQSEKKKKTGTMGGDVVGGARRWGPLRAAKTPAKYKRSGTRQVRYPALKSRS